MAAAPSVPQLCQLVLTISSARMSRCSSSNIAVLISSAVMKSCMSIHDSISLTVMDMPGISSSLFVSWLCEDSQPVMNGCNPGLYRILCHTNGFVIVFFGTCVIGLQHLS